MSITGKHDDRMYFLSAHLIVKHFVCSFLTKLNKPMPTDYNKLFPFGIVPVFTLGYTWFLDINAYLATIQGMYKFCETATLIYIHFQVEDRFFFW